MTNISKQNAVNNIYSDLYKQVRCASTADVNISTGLVAGQVIDGTTLVAGDLVLLKNQSTASQNGIYPATSAGAASRWVNYNTDKAIRGSKVLVKEGTAGAGFIWACGNTSAITVDSTSITYTRTVRETIMNNITITVKTSGGDFTTLADALAFLAPFEISASATVTISVGNGVFTTTSTLYLNHPNGDRINIQGETIYEKTLNTSGMNSVQSSSGSSGSWSIILNLTDVDNITTSDYVLVKYYTDNFGAENLAGGTLRQCLNGVFAITNVDTGNKRITITSQHKHTSAPSGAITGKIKIIKSVINNTSEHFGIITTSINFDNIVFVGTNTKHALWVLGKKSECKLGQNCGFTGWYRGIFIDGGGYCYCYNNCFSGNTRSIQNNNGYVDGFYVTVTGSTIGAFNVFMGFLYSPYSNISGNTDGVKTQGAYSLLSYSYINLNTTDSNVIVGGYASLVSVTYTTITPAINTVDTYGNLNVSV